MAKKKEEPTVNNEVGKLKVKTKKENGKRSANTTTKYSNASTG